MIELTKRALHRLKVVAAVTDRRLTQAEAGRHMGLTTRQVKRLVAACRAGGAAGLVSRRVGQASNRRLKEPLREAIRALRVDRYSRRFRYPEIKLSSRGMLCLRQTEKGFNPISIFFKRLSRK